MRYSLHIIFLIFFISCGERNNYIPDVFINHEIDLNSPENISAAIMRLQTFEDRFLYVIKFLDKDTRTVMWCLIYYGHKLDLWYK